MSRRAHVPSWCHCPRREPSSCSRGEFLTSVRPGTRPDGTTGFILVAVDCRVLHREGVYRFFGTSAADPHVAAVAALMLQLKGGRKSLSPHQIYAALEATAIDMNDPFTPDFDCGFDLVSGAGLVNASAALQITECPITFKLYNGDTNDVVWSWTNGVTVASSPPCGRANIEAVVPCGDSDLLVMLELVQGCNTIIRSYQDVGVPYFLFSNKGTDVYNGKIPAGSYRIRALVNGEWSPYTSFTLLGTCA